MSETLDSIRVRRMSLNDLCASRDRTRGQISDRSRYHGAVARNALHATVKLLDAEIAEREHQLATGIMASVRYTLLTDGTIATNHDLCATDWTASWWCHPNHCCASDGVQCPCGRWRVGHDMGDV